MKKPWMLLYPHDNCLVVVAGADGPATEVSRMRDELLEVLGQDAASVHAPADPATIAEVWHWRDGVSTLLPPRPRLDGPLS